MEGTQICRACDTELPLTKFKKRGGRQAGQRHTMCNRCLYVRYTRPNADKKKQEIDAYKVEKGCADCGYNAHPAALEFDHLPGVEKNFNIGEQVGGRSHSALWAEIAKCEVVCANCHNIRTDTRRVRVENQTRQVPVGRRKRG